MPEDLDLSSSDAVLIDSGGGLAVGQRVAAAGDTNGDGLGDLLVTGTGEAWLVHSPVSGTYDLAAADVRLSETTLCALGGCDLAGVGDLDGDGNEDLAVGHAYEVYSSMGAGIVYILPGPLEGDIDLADSPAQWVGELEFYAAGWALGAAGDVDGDGLDDLLVGSPYVSRTASEEGAAYLVLGSSAATSTGSTGLASSDAHWLGASAGDHAGADVAGGGDANGDGLNDLLVGAPEESSAGQWAGAAYLVLGRADIASGSSYWLDDADATLLGERAFDSVGTPVAWAGDMDGDGLDDILVGAPTVETEDADGGAAYLVCGFSAGTHSLSMATARLYGQDGSWTGCSLAAPGDLDGDDHRDLAVGAPGPSTSEALDSAVWIVHGPLSGSLPLSDAGIPIHEERHGDRAGASVAGVGDSDGDGLPDLLVGAPGSDRAGDDDGAAFLVTGSVL